ncbi:unnamed protein product [Rotaria socialis]|uniref:Uncharacterized protein n=1 Tax=Rotaria socialis TaxID=392032 RepID=A0A821PXE2_9BILA|nr:unnamed protein product [Rotaria socialis]
MEYLQTLQLFSTAQRIGCRLFNRINDQVPHVSGQELRPVKQIEVKTYNREPIQGIICHAILRNRNLASKISNQLNRIRSRNTPMSIFLEQFKFMDGFKMD